jgi:hypothetical protein
VFKVGDRIRQINKNYATTRIGWTGTVTNINYRDTIIVQWDQFPTAGLGLVILSKDAILIRNQQYICYSPVNQPETE